MSAAPMNDDARPFRPIADLVAEHARTRPQAAAVVDAGGMTDYAGLDAAIDRIAAGLQRDGVAYGETIAIAAAASTRYVALFLGALRAGVTVVPLAANVTLASFREMLKDAGVRALFADHTSAPLLAGAQALPRVIALDGQAPGTPFDAWLPPADARPRPVPVTPDLPFNIIYSSGTTGSPKGIVQSHGMRWRHVMYGPELGYGPQAVTLIATPLYSNTTLVTLLPTLAWGGCLVLMEKFDTERYLELAERHRATHTMLVPVQVQRLMAAPGFARRDLSSFLVKFCTSAPFAAALKADVLRRWPGALVEYYGMTEGGGSCELLAHEHPDKLHTVGRPVEGHDIRIIDEQGRELPRGEIGEIVGASAAMMLGYHGRPGPTAAAQWTSPEGRVFIRTGDVGRFDEDGFLTLMDRRKDMIISGGFNVYPSDLEAVLREHPQVLEAAVVGMPSERWGETPVAWVVPAPGAAIGAEALRAWANERLGKTQRLAELHFTGELPRSPIGKVLKTELRQRGGAA